MGRCRNTSQASNMCMLLLCMLLYAVSRSISASFVSEDKEWQQSSRLWGTLRFNDAFAGYMQGQFEDRVCRFLACMTPHSALRIFDWKLFPYLWIAEVAEPRTIIVDPQIASLQNFSRLLATSVVHNATLALGNGDTHLSKVKGIVQRLQRTGRFNRILFQSKDIEMRGIGTMPTGLLLMYVTGRFSLLANAILKSNVEKKLALPNVIGAWGSWFPNRKLKKHGKHAFGSRVAAKEFAKEKAWVNTSIVPRHLWFDVLQQHSFLLCPAGGSLQNGKMIEALLVQTIPIVIRSPAIMDLRCSLGYPLVVVEKWNEVTPERLVHWWQELKPCLDQFRWWLTRVGWAKLVMGDINHFWGSHPACPPCTT